MEQWKGGLFGARASTPQRKLQKGVTKQRSCHLGKQFHASISRPVTRADISNTQDDESKFLTPRQLSSASLDPSNPRPDLPSRRHGQFYERETPFPPLERLRQPAQMFSELSHLIPGKQLRRHSSTQIRRALSISKMKPRRKTPTLSIAPVEDAPKPCPGHDRTRTSSVDLIAEQYRTLLEVRRDSTYSDTDCSQHDDSHNCELLATTTERRRSSSYYSPEESPLDPSLDFAEWQDISPRSENDTLVSFDDEAVYFKPVSFSPELPSQFSHHHPSFQTTTERRLPSPSLSSSSASSANDSSNVSLQICLDLLTRELSAAIGGSRPASHSSSSSSPESESNSGMSALQVWAMIEAYERLRDQLVEIGTTTATTASHGRKDDDEDEDGRRAREMERMFDMWLRALYAIHDSLAR
ncbi:uncharacterized protein B0T15DRAFT_275259 [Chaetomium strumarium]|uniref:Mating-type switching protein swi10 n=1 Tax=Chaetomium strumarium TaxID=1170767 RepID=A0AAJ0GPB4_9PEZI|nr:hypothetical protein B0T15DRAFT_275259 [Chaetomium strumarium]